MSIPCQSWVYEHSEARGNDRLVLLAIADEANDDGTNAYPGIRRIAHKARVPVRTVMRCLDRLQDLGELHVIKPKGRGRGNFNSYVVLMGRSPDLFSRVGGVSGATMTPIRQEEKGRATVPNPLHPELIGEDEESRVARHEMCREKVPQGRATVPNPLLTLDPISQKQSQSQKHATTPPNTPPLPLDPEPPDGGVSASTDFEDFWLAYPRRNGKRLDKQAATRAWAKLTQGERTAARRGVEHYGAAVAAGLTIAADAHRWLTRRAWGDWQEPAVPDHQRRRHNGLSDPAMDELRAFAERKGMML